MPCDEEEAVVYIDGTALTVNSPLRALRAGCESFGLSKRGSKQMCLKRMLDHLQMQTLLAAHGAEVKLKAEGEREAKAQHVPKVPTPEEIQQHNLTHEPYKDWCEICVKHRARQDAHPKSSHENAGHSVISFDFCYTKAVPDTMAEKDVDTMISLVMIDSATGYLHSVPLRSKNQWNLMVRELLGFTGILGHSEIVFYCDNEPTLRQLLRMVVNARLSMGLPTRHNTSAPYSHSNALVENAVGRIRPLAGTLMHFLSEQVGVEFSSNSPWWSWAFRHASFLLNRFTPTRGATPYEILYQKEYGGAICNFWRACFWFCKSDWKGNCEMA